MKKFYATVSSIVLAATVMTGVTNAADIANTNSVQKEVSVSSSQKIEGAAALKAATEYFQNIVNSSASGTDGIPLTDFKIVSTDVSDLNNIRLSVNLTYKEIGTLPVISYSVEKVNGTYTVKEESIIYEMALGTPEYGTVKIGQAREDKTTGIQAKSAISGSYYSNDAPGYGLTTYFSGQSFTTTQSNITITGWQIVSPNSPVTTNLQVKYGIAAKLSGSTSFVNLAKSGIFSGEYPSSGTWLNANLTGVAFGALRCVFVENGGFATARVSGNAYE